MMRLPIQAPPVKRPHFIQPHETVDIDHGEGEDLISIRVDLQHGANFNDPARFEMPEYQRTMQSAADGLDSGS